MRWLCEMSVKEKEGRNRLSLHNTAVHQRYSTKEKSMKVLDMIQEAYADAKLNEILLPDVCKSASESQRGKDNTLIAKTIRKDFMKKMIFQMPADSEVEV